MHWFLRHRLRAAVVCVLCCAPVACGPVGCASKVNLKKTPPLDLADRIQPSNFRDWVPDQAVLATADIRGDRVTVKNVRYCKHLAPGEYVPDYYDKSFNLRRVQAVDFITMPFGPVPSLAHTLVSFELAPEAPMAEPEHLVISVEVRKEKDEPAYNPVLSAMRQYELIYVVTDERDILRRQAVINNQDTYLYRTTAPPEAAQEMLVSMLRRANELAQQPQFYDLFTNNCTTNIVEHVNLIRPNRVVYDIGVLLPGLSDRKAYAEGLIVGEGDFEQVKARANIRQRAQLADGSADFSSAIRR
ncbi:hypothetical protein Pla123a_13310 [Posidoniimonas polymericola]|uniref:Lnb N-terminal periplasmic domain-containing protein n=1 Tax=Posidoniimonas polymericola TaxID=2528002 RepID=A0A5C5YU80_9BACT|nr:hypothetical protein Pla123a_13310 [Posidoniimonas polymericola]